jgi:hypothetical protein
LGNLLVGGPLAFGNKGIACFKVRGEMAISGFKLEVVTYIAFQHDLHILYSVFE